MKILYLITKSNFGGAQRYVYDLALAAKEAGHDVAVGFGQEGPLGDRLEKAGIRTISLSLLGRDVSLGSDLRSLLEIFHLLHEEHPDLVHLNSSKVGALGSLAARIHNAREHLCFLVCKKGARPVHIVFTGHGWTFNEDRPTYQRILIGIAHWITILLSHQTIAVSEKTREQVARFPLTDRRVVVIHNGAHPLPLLSRGDARAKLFPGGDQIPEDAIVVGVIAELHANKGLRYAIEAMAHLRKQGEQRAHLIIIGEGEERIDLEFLIHEHGLQTHVHLIGQRDDAASLLSAFDIFLLPSITEAFPYVILEAGKSGLPIVASAVGGIPEVIDDMESGVLIHPRSSGEIARAISYLITHPDRAREFGSAVKSRIADRFTIEQMIAATLALYAEIHTVVTPRATTHPEPSHDH
jgi:glycosyltransferase involved in cell wall biosynthesis